MRRPIRLLSSLLILVVGSAVAFVRAEEPNVRSPENRPSPVSPLRYRIFDGDRIGYMDRQGREMIPCQYDSASEFSDGYAIVEKGGVWALIDTEGRAHVRRKARRLFVAGCGLYAILDEQLILASLHSSGPEYRLDYDEAMGPFAEGLLAVRKSEHWGFIDALGKTIIKPEFLRVMPFSEGIAAAADDRGWGFIDHTGKWAIPPSFHFVDKFSNGIALVVDRQQHRRYINHQGQFIFGDTVYSEAYRFHEGLAVVRPRSVMAFSFGYIDVRGNYVIAPRVASPKPFSEGSAAVQLEDDSFGYIDRYGNVRLRCEKARSVGPFKNGLAFVNEPERSGYIDPTGRWVWSRNHPRNQDKELESAVP